MSEENKNLNTISEDTANADSNAVAETCLLYTSPSPRDCS